MRAHSYTTVAFTRAGLLYTVRQGRHDARSNQRASDWLGQAEARDGGRRAGRWRERRRGGNGGAGARQRGAAGGPSRIDGARGKWGCGRAAPGQPPSTHAGLTTTYRPGHRAPPAACLPAGARWGRRRGAPASAATPSGRVLGSNQLISPPSLACKPLDRSGPLIYMHDSPAAWPPGYRTLKQDSSDGDRPPAGAMHGFSENLLLDICR